MLSDQLHEASLYKDNNFPFAIFTVDCKQCLPPGPGYHYLHWHEDLQFTLVTMGSVCMQVNGTNYDLNMGDAIFINSGFLHMTNHISDNGEYISFNFSAKLLSFFYGSQLEMDYVLPFTSNYRFPVKLFSSTVLWENLIIENLWNLKELYLSEEIYGKNYEIIIRLTKIWLAFIRNVQNSLEKPSKSFIRKQENLQAMLAFIHSNYMKEISLSDIAQTSHISIGECCRCFKNTLHITPYEYLISFRINKSADLLKDSNHSVTTIAGMVGFNDSSHFIQLFKRKMKLTPNEYKKYIK
ncbi:MAG: helix-turn-helix domain-containing protein [Lachnotalea sp.]